LQEFVKRENIQGTLELIPFQKNPTPFLQKADVFILATYKETYSLSVIDAMLMGLPVIGTNTGGTTEQIKHNERGILIAPRSAEDIAKAIAFYVNHPQERQEHGKAAWEWATQEHSWEHTLETLRHMYST
jgi:D-inositol-3-phosphate glycosyltransferase